MLTDAERQLYEGGLTPATQQNGPTGFIGAVQDVGQGIIHGAGEAVRSTYNLLDLVDNKLFNILEPSQDPFFDAPETFLGQLAGGATQFFLPYGLFTKGLQGVAGLNLISKAPKVQGAVSWFGGIKSAEKINSLANAAATGGKFNGWSKLTSAVAGASSTLARSSLTDFVAFEGAGARLSELVQANPEFANPLTEWLAGDEEDSELEGRFKNVIEGFGLGVAFDTLAAWRRGSKGAKVVEEAGGSTEEIAAAFVRGTDESLQAAGVKAAAARDEDLAANVGDSFTYRNDAGEIIEETVVAQRAKIDQQVSDFYDALEITNRADFLEQTYDANGLLVKPDSLTDEALKELGVKVTGENLNYLTNANGMAYLVRAIEATGNARGKGTVVPNAETFANSVQEAAELAGLSLDDGRAVIAKLSAKSAQDVRAAMNQVQAFRLVSTVMAEKLLPQVQELLKSPSWTWESHNTATNALQSFVDLQNGIRSVTSEFGRALQSVSIKIDGNVVRKQLDADFTFKPLDALRDWTQETFDPTVSKAILDDALGMMHSPNPLDNIRALSEWSKMPLHRKITVGASEYYINALLSAPTSHLINTVSGVTMSYFRSIERWASSKIGGFFGSDEEKLVARAMAEGEMATIANISSDMAESWRMVRQSGSTPFATNTPFDRGGFSGLRESAKGTLFQPIANLVTTPSRLLTAEDAAVKDWVGRGRFRAVYRQQLAGQGVHPSELTARVEEGLQAVYRAKGSLREQSALSRAFREAEALGGPVEALPDAAAALTKLDDPQLEALLRANDDAVLRAKEATFSTELGTQGLGFAGRLIQRLQDKHPVTRFFMPFVRTPVNIAEYGFDRSVGAVIGTTAEVLRRGANLIPGIDIKLNEQAMTKLQRQLASPDPAVRIEARGRMAYGITLVGSIMTQVSMDRGDGELPLVTGTGPSDPAVRKALELSGWQPFSIKFGDKYVSYSRIDPFATLIGITVDAAEFIKESEDEDDTNFAMALVTGLAVSAANNVTKKTYFQGLQDTLGAFTRPDEELPRLMRNTAGGFIPGIVAATERTVDPDLQETRTLMDKIMSRVPGWSDNLDTRRNILGEPISVEYAAGQTFNPFRISTVSDSVIDKEISKFSYGFRVPGTRRAGVDLLSEEFNDGRASAYDRWMRLSGEVKVRGMTLRQALRMEIKSPDYQRLSEKDGPNGEVSPRVASINKVIRKYRSAAWNQLLRETPELAKETRRLSVEAKQFRNGSLSFPSGN